MASAGSNLPPIVVKRVVKKGGGGHHGGAWKVAYADFVTAMMAFFMLLWLLANPDKEQLRGLAEFFSPAPPSPAPTAQTSISESAGAGGRSRRAQGDSQKSQGEQAMEAGTVGAARGGTAAIPDASMRVLAEELRLMLNAVPAASEGASNLSVEPARDGVRISLMDSENRSMFRGGTAELNGFAREMLGGLARRLGKSGVQIAIEGHTDGAGGNGEANWRLSADRALAARGAMVDAGLTPDHFTEVVALAGTRPVYADQPERPENRRITLVVSAEASSLPSDVSFKF